ALLSAPRRARERAAPPGREVGTEARRARTAHGRREGGAAHVEAAAGTGGAHGEARRTRRDHLAALTTARQSRDRAIDPPHAGSGVLDRRAALRRRARRAWLREGDARERQGPLAF